MRFTSSARHGYLARLIGAMMYSVVNPTLAVSSFGCHGLLASAYNGGNTLSRRLMGAMMLPRLSVGPGEAIIVGLLCA
jgi:hypothetical protein